MASASRTSRDPLGRLQPPARHCFWNPTDGQGFHSKHAGRHAVKILAWRPHPIIQQEKSDLASSDLSHPHSKFGSCVVERSISSRPQQVFEHSVDMCSETSLTCPLKAGEDMQVSASQTLPEGIPPVSGLKVVVQATDDTGVISCIEVELELAVGEYSLDHLSRLSAIDSALVTDILMAGTTWTPHFSPRFAGATLKQAQGLMGTWLRGHPLHMTLKLKEIVMGPAALKGENMTIPEAFDAREAWPECAELIGRVKDQSACGSCWAFASSAAFEDRMCIAHGSKDLLSPTDTLACCTGMACGFSQGCNGGQPAGAWSFFASQGVVSGGLFEEVGTGTTCMPYPFLTCAHHVEPTEELPACPAEDFETPRCRHTCSEELYEETYSADKRMAKRGYSVRANVEEIQKEIMESGPVSAAFTVYQDFLTYSGEGVYQHVTGAPLGGHAVK